MSLTLVATPIGHPEDITLRAINTLKSADVIIGEEFREVTTLLKRLDIAKPQLEKLNEHSREEDLKFFLEICRAKNVVLVSDCGTPGFCDPGADLVRLCREHKVTVTTVPGASSLMTLLSMSGIKTSEFIFRGFPPAKKELRRKALDGIAAEEKAQILMDTPYRLGKLLTELSTLCPHRQATIGLNMTQENEAYESELISDLAAKYCHTKAEFVLFLNTYTSPTKP